MKLKYILRGIGIGILVTVAVLYPLVGREKPLNDDAVRNRARELGMLTVDEFQDRELNSLKDKIPKISDIKLSDEKNTTKETPEDNSDKSLKKPENKKKISNKAGESSKSVGGRKISSDTGTETSSTAKSETRSGENTETDRVTPKTTSPNADAEAGNTTNTGIEARDTEKKPSGNASSKMNNSAKAVDSQKSVSPTPDNDKVSISIIKGMSSENVSALLKSNGIIRDSADFNSYLVRNGYSSNIRVGNFMLSKEESYSEIIKKIVKDK